MLVEVEAGLRVGKNWTASRGQVSGGHLEFGVCVCAQTALEDLSSDRGLALAYVCRAPPP